MKSALTILFLASIQLVLCAGELREEIDSYGEAFHHALHRAPEIYLVCYYQVDKKPWAKQGEQLDIKATIVEVIRGKRKVGDRITFERVLDGKYGDVSKLQGTLQYVQYHRDEHKGSPEFGKLSIDPQDPQAIFGHTPELSKMVLEHRTNLQEYAPP